jgi:hydroxyacylglutathione hydrolase
MPIEIFTIESMPFAENSYVLHHTDRSDAIVFDAGFEPGLILEYLEESKLELAAIINTHGHSDHIAGNHAMKKAFPQAPIVIGEIDAAMLTDPELNLSRSFGFSLISPEADRRLQHGDILEYAGITMDVRFTPGHSPGHVVFLIRDLIRDAVPLKVIGGDVLFREGVGRSDFPNGSFEQLAKSIRTQLYTLPNDTVVYPGHGPVTTIGHEKQNNPFVPGKE